MITHTHETEKERERERERKKQGDTHTEYKTQRTDGLIVSRMGRWKIDGVTNTDSAGKLIDGRINRSAGRQMCATMEEVFFTNFLSSHA